MDLNADCMENGFYILVERRFLKKSIKTLAVMAKGFLLSPTIDSQMTTYTTTTLASRNRMTSISYLPH